MIATALPAERRETLRLLDSAIADAHTADEALSVSGLCGCVDAGGYVCATHEALCANVDALRHLRERLAEGGVA